MTAVAYSPDGRLLASSGFDTRVRLWDAATGEPLGRLEGHTERVRCVAFSPDGKWLASGGDDYQIRLWDVAARRERPSPLSGHMAAGRVAGLLPGREDPVQRLPGKAVWAWDPATGKALKGWPIPAPSSGSPSPPTAGRSPWRSHKGR